MGAASMQDSNGSNDTQFLSANEAFYSRQKNSTPSNTGNNVTTFW